MRSSRPACSETERTAEAEGSAEAEGTEVEGSEPEGFEAAAVVKAAEAEAAVNTPEGCRMLVGTPGGEVGPDGDRVAWWSRASGVDVRGHTIARAPPAQPDESLAEIGSALNALSWGTSRGSGRSAPWKLPCILGVGNPPGGVDARAAWFGTAATSVVWGPDEDVRFRGFQGKREPAMALAVECGAPRLPYAWKLCMLLLLLLPSTLAPRCWCCGDANECAAEPP